MGHEQLADADADANIQWKGTDLCMDFQCTCRDSNDAYEFHYDGYPGGNRFKCPDCGAEWSLWVMVVPYVAQGKLDEYGEEPEANILSKDEPE